MGERPCSSVARVRGAIDTLVALVTVEAQSYGPKACILMRVVETVSTIATPPTPGQSSSNATSVSVATPVSNATPVAAAAPPTPATTATPTPAPNPPKPISPAPSRPSTPASTSTKSASHSEFLYLYTNKIKSINGLFKLCKFCVCPAEQAAEAVNSLQQQHAHQQIIQENEQFALGWLKATFEVSGGVRLEQEELYKKYLGCCTKIGRRGVIAPLHFPRCVR